MDVSSGEKATQLMSLVVLGCWLPYVYQTLVCRLGNVLILEFTTINGTTGSSFLEWSWEMMTSNGGINQGGLCTTRGGWMSGMWKSFRIAAALISQVTFGNTLDPSVATRSYSDDDDVVNSSPFYLCGSSLTRLSVHVCSCVPVVTASWSIVIIRVCLVGVESLEGYYYGSVWKVVFEPC